MTPEEIITKSEAFGGWYHRIELTPGYWTKSCMSDAFPVWDMIRRVRSKVHYGYSSVLDLGTFDGMWAFEAEALGAPKVVAADIWQAQANNQSAIPLNRMLFAREALGSKVFPVTNGQIHNLHERLTDAMRLMNLPDGFDIIQCLGLLYHVENPILALQQIRKCLAPNGCVLLETACLQGFDHAPFVRLNTDNGVYLDNTTFWVPNKKALLGMLALADLIPGSDFEDYELPHDPARERSYRTCGWVKILPKP